MIKLVPIEVKKVLIHLNKAGYAGYIVGGAVRDMLMGSNPVDYDIATNARTNEVLSLAAKMGWKTIDNLGQNFGVVVIFVDNRKIEVATFRSEEYGTDSHKPDSVSFSVSIEEDLSRRDFTINALAMDVEGNIIDPFEGALDIRNKIIRCVGDAKQRFNEDALRMFRACRFAAQLGFKIDDQIYKAIPYCLDNVKGLSLDRVKSELEKILLAEYPELGFDAMVKTYLCSSECRIKKDNKYFLVKILPELDKLVGLKQNPICCNCDVWQHTLLTVKTVSPTMILRWGALLHKLEAQMSKEMLSRLQYNSKFADRISWLVLKQMKFHYCLHLDESLCWGWVREEALSGSFRSTVDLVEAFSQMIKLCIAGMVASQADKIDVDKAKNLGDKIYSVAVNMPVHTSDLCVSGKDILNNMGEEIDIGSFLKSVLRRVQDGVIVNNEKDIKHAALVWNNSMQEKNKNG